MGIYHFIGLKFKISWQHATCTCGRLILRLTDPGRTVGATPQARIRCLWATVRWQCRILSLRGNHCYFHVHFSHNLQMLRGRNDKGVFEEMHRITQWDYRPEAARPWEKTVSPAPSLSRLAAPPPHSRKADGYPTLRLHSAMHTRHPVSPLRGQLRSCLLESSHRGCIFTFKPAAGSFAVDSTELIYFIQTPMKCRFVFLFFFFTVKRCLNRSFSEKDTCSQPLLAIKYF